MSSININFNRLQKSSPDFRFSRPEKRKVREEFTFSPRYSLLFQQHSLEGIIGVIKRADADDLALERCNQRYSHYAGFSKNQLFGVLDDNVRNVKQYKQSYNSSEN